jgi:hypothetical protein
MDQRTRYLTAMIEQLTAKVEVITNACREATEASLEKVKAETDFDRKEMKADREATEVCQQKMEVSVHSMRAWRKEAMDCQQTTGAYLQSKEPASVQMESESELQEVTKEEATVKYFGTLEKRNGDRHLAIGRHEKPNERTQGKGESRKKLAAAGRGMTRCEGVARRKGHGRQGQGKDVRRDVGRNRKASMEKGNKA